MFPDPTFICELRRVPCCPVDRKGQLLVEATDSAQMNMLVDAKECQRVEMGSSLQEVSLSATLCVIFIYNLHWKFREHASRCTSGKMSDMKRELRYSENSELDIWHSSPKSVRVHLRGKKPKFESP